MFKPSDTLSTIVLIPVAVVIFSIVSLKNLTVKTRIFMIGQLHRKKKLIIFFPECFFARVSSSCCFEVLVQRNFLITTHFFVLQSKTPAFTPPFFSIPTDQFASIL